MFGGSRLRRLVLAVLVVLVAGGSAYAYRHRDAVTGDHGFNPAALPPVTEVTASVSPSPNAVAAATPSPSPSLGPLPPAFRLGVPYTTQAPLADWPKHQESCEEATLAMIAAYWSGSRQDTIEPHAADRTIADLVAWQVKNWGSEDDLTDVRFGELARGYYGYRYAVLPITTEADIQRQLVAGRPVVLGTTTHGLGNPNYPHYQDHKLQLPYDVSHFIAIVGYDSQGFILNDPGITLGHGYHVTFTQLLFAIDDLDSKYPKLNEGHVMVVITPAA